VPVFSPTLARFYDEHPDELTEGLLKSRLQLYCLHRDGSSELHWTAPRCTREDFLATVQARSDKIPNVPKVEKTVVVDAQVPRVSVSARELRNVPNETLRKKKKSMKSYT